MSDDPAVWIAEGIDRSGLTGIFFDINNIIEKGTRGAVGVNAVRGGPMMSRYARRNVLGPVLGPTAGTIQDIATVTGAVATGEARRADVRAARRLLPYQNIFYIRGLLNQAGDAVAAEYGLE